MRVRTIPPLIALLLAVAPAIAIAEASWSTVRSGTFAYDYRNEPSVSRFEGYEFVVLSARGASLASKVDSVHAWGGKVLALVQPTLAAWDHVPWTNAAWDRMLWDAARRTGGVLRGAAGDTMWLFPGRRDDAALVDFGAAGMADSLASAILALHGDGVVWDYGCGTVPVNGVAEETAARWSAGWDTLVTRVRTARPEWTLVCQCNQFTRHATPDRCDGLLLERVGHSLNPPLDVWTRIAADPRSRFFLRQEDGLASRRRLFAAIALLTGGVFVQCLDPDRAPSVAVRDPEHWELDLGQAAGPWRRRSPGIYERAFTQGLVIANLGPGAYRHAGRDGRTRTIPPHDALIAQTRSASGSLARWITTSDR